MINGSVDVAGTPRLTSLSDYMAIARPDHYFKNVFMLPGILLAWLAVPSLDLAVSVGHLIEALIATCLICSSNYTINELLDAKHDRNHPDKHVRPVAAGRISTWAAIVQWILLGLIGLGIAWNLGLAFFKCAAALLVMGVVYNVKPLRAKDVPYIDVLTESINNPLRLLMGWHALAQDLVMPISIVLSYWMFGAFFMAVKRYAELRHIDDRATAASYRRSFAHYTEQRLLLSIVFYVTAFAFFFGVFLIRYRIELVLTLPFLAGFVAYYLHLGMLPYSPTQHPEKLYRQRLFMVYCTVTAVLIFFCLLVDIPPLVDLFDSTIPAGI